MKKSELMRYFKTQAEAAKVLGITRQAMQQWGEDIPEFQRLKFQYEILPALIKKVQKG